MNINEISLRNTLPVVINSFNQYAYLKNIIEKFQKNFFKNIYVIDNNSTNPDLINFYNELNSSRNITIIYYNNNLGPRAFHTNNYFEIFYKTPHLYTDPDLDFDSLNDEFLSTLLNISIKYEKCKVGCALEIPKQNEIKDNISFNNGGVLIDLVSWEKKFWSKEVETNIYEAGIDTTLHLFNPNFYKPENSYFDALRVGKKGFIVKHLPWYKDNKINTIYDDLIYKSTQKGWNNF